MSNPTKSIEASLSSYVEVTSADMPLACPTPKMTLWNMHPKIYLALENGEATCPYCGTKYKLIEQDAEQ